jgi:Kef-type K+ transport system membrane component KefB
MNTHDIWDMLFALGLLLFCARLLGEVSRRLGQPALLGELIAGIMLGPTLLGRIAPNLSTSLFPKSGAIFSFFAGFNTLAVVFLLLLAGIEVNLSTILKKRASASLVSLSGIAVPFALGLLVAVTFPTLVIHHTVDFWTGALFFATAMSISALPVIAKIFMDLGIYQSEVGQVTMAAAVIDDLAGWMIFAVVLGMAGQSSPSEFTLMQTIALTLGFALFMLTVGRRIIDVILGRLLSWSKKILSFCISITLFAAAFTEWVGIHALFGAFMCGVAIGDSRHLNDKTKSAIEQFVMSFFAPIFFASIGLKVDFVAHFNWLLVVAVLLIACAGKILGCGLAAKASGMPNREALSVGVAMNARGAMEIILGLLALQHGLIGEELFVALVVMAAFTSLMAGPLLVNLSTKKTTHPVAEVHGLLTQKLD